MTDFLLNAPRWWILRAACYIALVMLIWDMPLLDFFLIVAMRGAGDWANYRQSHDIIDQLDGKITQSIKDIDEALKRGNDESK